MAKHWTVDDVLAMQRMFQPACVLAAAADLDLFNAMAGQRMSAPDVAARIGGDLRATTILLDALAALELLNKDGGHYEVPPSAVATLTDAAPGNVLAMAQHQANCLRRWAHIAEVVKSGRPAERTPSVRGEAADYAAFIEAMDNLSAPVAAAVVAEAGVGSFKHALDVGGGSGSWTLALLHQAPSATATIFDLPHVRPQAEARMKAAGLADRVTFVAGDYMSDELPAGADLAWVSAIIHSLSREQSRMLYAKVHRALAPGGRIMIRDLIMDATRTKPVAGALFAVNMLTGTAGGGTYTFDEMRQDLQSAGFSEVKIVRPEDTMNAVIAARKPG